MDELQVNEFGIDKNIFETVEKASAHIFLLYGQAKQENNVTVPPEAVLTKAPIHSYQGNPGFIP